VLFLGFFLFLIPVVGFFFIFFSFCLPHLTKLSFFMSISFFSCWGFFPMPAYSFFAFFFLLEPVPSPFCVSSLFSLFLFFFIFVSTPVPFVPPVFSPELIFFSDLSVLSRLADAAGLGRQDDAWNQIRYFFARIIGRTNHTTRYGPGQKKEKNGACIRRVCAAGSRRSPLIPGGWPEGSSRGTGQHPYALSRLLGRAGSC